VAWFVPLSALLPLLHPQTGENALLVVNRNDAVSRQIGDYYRPRGAPSSGQSATA